MKSPLLTIIPALLFGVAIGAYMVRDRAPADPESDFVARNGAQTPGSAMTDPDGTWSEISELKQQLQREIEARQALQARLDALSEQVAGLSFESSDSQQALAVGDRETQSAQETDPNQAWFDEQALIANGIEQSLARELRVYFEQIEMQRLQLRDQSVREGWERGRLREEMQRLGESEQALRERLGESAYDAYLYASGRPNRVAVTSVLASAQAGQAGIRAGDLILRYDNQPIYNWRDLREATTGGNISDTVSLEIERDGSTIEYYLARGPLGIRMDSVSVAP